MTELHNRLFAMGDEAYADFQAKLTPNVAREKFIGIRVPVLRDFAKLYYKEEYHDFIMELPHYYYDENMLHGLLLSLMKNYDECIEALRVFLPYVDNWAVCDIMYPKIFSKNKEKLIDNIREWIKSEHTYTCRFGMNMLMKLYLDEDFKEEYLEIVASVKSEEYYVNMMIAWFFATALAKQWDATIPYIENNCLGKWTHNKAIQKSIESYRVSEEQKEYLRKLKIK